VAIFHPFSPSEESVTTEMAVSADDRGDGPRQEQRAAGGLNRRVSTSSRKELKERKRKVSS
jgi:hypothetical protein